MPVSRFSMLTRTAMAAALLAGGLLSAAPALAGEELLVAEPVHNLGYLPLYVAMDKGYFEPAGLTVKVITIETGSGHTNAVLTKQAFAFIGGPEHNAFARAKGAELRAVVNVVNRGNVYFVAQPDAHPDPANLAAFVKGKRIATGFYSGTPDSITRFMLGQWKLDATKDVTLIETTTAAIFASMKAKQADIGVIAEPNLTQGIREKVWAEPIYNVPKELGDYAYSTLNILKESIDQKPKVVEGFVRGVIQGLRYTYSNPKEAAAIGHKYFPTMSVEDETATLDRSFKDELWSPDGMISPAAWDTASKVVRTAGILKVDVAYDEIIDMSFVKSVLSTH